jgi:type IV secretory pathway VirB3-like protein
LDEISSDELWQEAQKHVSLTSRILVMDDSTLDNFYAKKMEMVTHHWSGFSWASNSYS